MADTVVIRCTTCGNKIGEITYVKGKQYLGCSKCGGRTGVKIYPDGEVRTWTQSTGKIQK